LLFGFEAHAGLGCIRWRDNFLRGGATKNKDADGKSKKDAPPACDTEFMKKSHELAPPIIPGAPLRISG